MWEEDNIIFSISKHDFLSTNEFNFIKINMNISTLNIEIKSLNQYKKSRFGLEKCKRLIKYQYSIA